MKKERSLHKKTDIASIFTDVATYIQDHFLILLSFVLTFMAVALLSVFRIASTGTMFSYNINEYEVGQIADMTIRATRSLPADEESDLAIQKGEKIIRKGFPITEEDYAKLNRMTESPVYLDYRSFANSVLYLILLGALYFFLFSEVCLHKKCEFKELVAENVFFLVTYAMAVLGTKTQWFASPFSLGVITPAVFFTFLMAILFGQLDAIYFAILASFGILNVSNYMPITFLYVLTTTLAASRIVRRIERRIDIVFAALLQAVLNVTILCVLKIIFNNSLRDGVELFAGVACNGFLSGILCLGFLTPLEYLLNTASVFRLMDLSDLNNPLMKKMLLTASGTYNHSMMVASLAEAACRAIGANSLLARVSGYFHDIGKVDNPDYFTENQQNKNIHTEINPSLSVSIIKGHVRKGVEKAREMRLPPQVVDVIGEHHGNQVMAWFYSKAKESDPTVNPGDYSYPGPLPSTKESAVVMLADTVEAACKSLDKPSASVLENKIQELVDSKISAHQLDNCNLTFKDLHLIKETFLQMLIGYYHARIKYPGQKDDEPEKRAEAAAVPPEKDKTAEKEAASETDKAAENEKGADGGKPSDKEKAADKEKGDKDKVADKEKGKSAGKGKHNAK